MTDRLAYSRQFNTYGATVSRAVGQGIAQGFYYSGSAALIGHVYVFTNHNDSTSVGVAIREVDGDDMPTSSVLASTSVNLAEGVLVGATISGTYPVYRHTATLPLSISDGVHYAIVLLPTDGTVVHWLKFRTRDWNTSLYDKDAGSSNWVNRWRYSQDAGITWILGGGTTSWMNFEVYGTPVIVYPSDSLTRVTGIRHIYRPGLFRMILSLGDVSNTIEIAEHRVRKELEIPEQRTPEPVVSGCEEGATSGRGANKYTCRGGVWTHTPEAEAAPPEAAPPIAVPPTEIPDYPSYWGGGPVSQIPGIEEYRERQRQRPPEEEKPSLWSRITPWKEEEGETFGSEVVERFEALRRLFGGMFGGR